MLDVPKSTNVQVLDRALTLLEILSSAPEGMAISELSELSKVPLPTVHRILQTLVHRGYVRRASGRRYALGPRLVPLGQTAATLLHHWVRPYLAGLVDALGETANMAVLDGDSVVYVAQVPSRHSMRMFTEVGRRVSLHCTGVGKALLAALPVDQALAILERSSLDAMTDRTFTHLDALMEELRLTRERGYAIDDGEQEVGVRCVAMVVGDFHALAAISISGPAARISLEDLPRICPLLSETASAISAEFSSQAE